MHRYSRFEFSAWMSDLNWTWNDGWETGQFTEGWRGVDDWFLDDVVLYGQVNRTPSVTLGGSTGNVLDGTAPYFTISSSDPDNNLVSTRRIVKYGSQVMSDVTNTSKSGHNLTYYPSRDWGLGTYSITVTATDANGKSDTETRSYTLKDDDTTAPLISLDGSSGTETQDEIQRFTWEVQDSQSGVAGCTVVISHDGAEIFRATEPFGGVNLDSYGRGEFVINVTATDGDNDRTGDSRTSTAPPAA